MKKILTFVFIVFFTSCKAQIKLVDLSVSDLKMNYVFARFYDEKPIVKNLFKESLHVKIFRFSDSKISTESVSSETEEFYDSYLVSISPDGDSYTKSKLYKIEKLFNPKILEIKEGKYPFVKIKVEYGFAKKRKTESFELKGL